MWRTSLLQDPREVCTSQSRTTTGSPASRRAAHGYKDTSPLTAPRPEIHPVFFRDHRSKDQGGGPRGEQKAPALPRGSSLLFSLSRNASSFELNNRPGSREPHGNPDPHPQVPQCPGLTRGPGPSRRLHPPLGHFLLAAADYGGPRGSVLAIRPVRDRSLEFTKQP